MAEVSAGVQRKARRQVPGRGGRHRGSAPVQPGESGFDLALDATLREALLRRLHEPNQDVPAAFPVDRPLALTFADLRKKRRFKPREHLIVLVVDASDSMGHGVEARMKAAKGAALSLLRRAYQDRSRVAFVAFGGEEARVALHPTASVEQARRQLHALPAGGATPMADGLFKAWQLVRLERLKRAGLRATLVLISDGEANTPMCSGADIFAELKTLAGFLAEDHVPVLFLDVVSRYERSDQARRIAQILGARYLRLDHLSSRCVLRAIRAADKE